MDEGVLPDDKVTQEKISTFLTKAKEDACDLPVWVGELYFGLHRGTYTTQARTKRGNRKIERRLHDAEFFSALAPGAGVSEVEIPPAVYDVTRKGEHGVAVYEVAPFEIVTLKLAPRSRCLSEAIQIWIGWT